MSRTRAKEKRNRGGSYVFTSCYCLCILHFRIGTVIFIAGTVTLCLAHSLIESVSGPCPCSDATPRSRTTRNARDWALPHTLSLYTYISLLTCFRTRSERVHSLTATDFSSTLPGAIHVDSRLQSRRHSLIWLGVTSLVSSVPTWPRFEGCPTGWPRSYYAAGPLAAVYFLVRRAIRGRPAM